MLSKFVCECLREIKILEEGNKRWTETVDFNG